MKSIYLIALFSFYLLAGFGQSQYESGMKRGLNLWGEQKPIEAVAMFERIAQVEKDNWLPLYYMANILIVQSFQDTVVSRRNERLKKAGKIIETAHQISPDNSELLTLEGLLYTGYVAMDPGTYGMMYSQKIMELHTKAIALNPNNPRAQANAIEFEMGAARFFNHDLKPFCERMKKIIPTFDSQVISEPFAPSYGKERAQQFVDNCGND